MCKHSICIAVLIIIDTENHYRSYTYKHMTGPNMYIDVGAVWNIEKISGQHRFPKAIILLTVSIPEITNPDLKKK